MDNFLVDTVIEKVDGQEKRLVHNEKILTEIEEKVMGISDQTTNLKKLGELVAQVQERMNKIVWPVEKMNELSFQLKVNNNLLSSPVKTKQTVVHTAGKLAWVIAVLFLIVVSLAFGLFELGDSLDKYKTNDLLWRYIKSTSKNQNLEYLQSVEKLHLEDPEKMKSWVESEELHQKQQLESGSISEVQTSTDTLSPHSKITEHKKKRK